MSCSRQAWPLATDFLSRHATERILSLQYILKAASFHLATTMANQAQAPSMPIPASLRICHTYADAR